MARRRTTVKPTVSRQSLEEMLKDSEGADHEYLEGLRCHKASTVTILQEIMANAAAATGLTFNDLMLQTPSRLRGMIYAAHVQAGMQMTKVSARAHADYLATLDASAKRLRAEKAARDAAAK